MTARSGENREKKMTRPVSLGYGSGMGEKLQKTAERLRRPAIAAPRTPLVNYAFLYSCRGVGPPAAARGRFYLFIFFRSATLRPYGEPVWIRPVRGPVLIRARACTVCVCFVGYHLTVCKTRATHAPSVSQGLKKNFPRGGRFPSEKRFSRVVPSCSSFFFPPCDNEERPRTLPDIDVRFINVFLREHGEFFFFWLFISVVFPPRRKY